MCIGYGLSAEQFDWPLWRPPCHTCIIVLINEFQNIPHLELICLCSDVSFVLFFLFCKLCQTSCFVTII